MRLRAARLVIEAEVQRLIDLLDAADAADVDREPDGDDEIVSEDDGVVIGLVSVGRQWS
jgi:hypothetical protein